MRLHLYALYFLLLLSNVLGAQTTLLNPAGDGGFESGVTFLTNGWQTAQTAPATNSKWAVGTAVVNSGTRGVYVSSDNGVTNTYATGNSRVQHFYRDITIPAGEPVVTVSFNWKGVGESADYLRVSVVTTATTPVAAALLPTANQIGSDLFGQTAWQTATFNFPCGLAGTTQRLVFTFRCNGSNGTQPPPAVDNISVVSSAVSPCNSSLGTGVTAVASLPYSSGAGTTCGAVNDLTSLNTLTCAGSANIAGEDRVWVFTPTTSGAITASVATTSITGSLALYSDCPNNASCNAGVCIASAIGGGLSVTACVTAGTTYRLVLDGTASPSCFAYTNLTITAPSTSCIAALGTGVVNVASLPYTSTGRTTCGKFNDVKSTNVSAVCGTVDFYDGEDEVFYFTPTASGIIQLALSSGGSYTSVAVYNNCPMVIGGCISSTATCLAFSQNTAGNKGLCFSATSGTTYYVVVDSDFPPVCNGYDITILAPQVSLAGTLCSNAPAITLPFSGINHTTTCYGNDYTNASSGSCGTTYESGEDRVYALTVSGSTCIGIRLSNASTTNIGFQVYNGCPGAAGTTCVANAGGSNPLNGAVTLPAAGTYFVIVDTWATPDNATYDITITDFGTGPSNDLPCNADPLPLNVNTTGDNTCSGSASEPGNGSCWTGGIRNTVWYTIVCPASGQLRIRTTNGTLSNTQIALYSGTCGSLTEIACNDDAPSCGGSGYTNSELAVTGLTAGATYFIGVDGTNDLVGTFDILAVNGTIGFPAQAGQDCSLPNPLCSSTITIGNPGYQAYGNNCDFDGSGICLSTGERGSVWYSIPINAAGVLEFDIVPNDWPGAPSTASTDYDFAVWKVTGSGSTSCTGIAAGAVPDRCNYDGLGVGGCFGTGNAPAAYPGFNAAYESQLTVVAGEVYLLVISNYTNSTSGFTLNINPTSPVNYVVATSVTWTGGTNTTAWAPTANWGGCASPTCGIDAVISPSAAVQPVLTAGTFNVRNLTINAGATLTLLSGATLNICGDFNNSGSLIAHPNSTIVFNNGSTTQTISGSFIGVDQMGNLTITKTGGSVVLNAAIDIGGNFTTSNATSILNTNGYYVRVARNFNNNAGNTTFTNVGTTGTLEFYGTAAQTYNQGSSTLTLNNVVMENTSTGVTLSTAMELGTSGVLTLNNGRINTGANEVRVFNTASGACSAGNTTSFVAGNLRRYLSGAAQSYNLPVGHATQGYQLANVTFTTATTIPQLLARFDPWAAVPNGPVSSECLIANYNVLPALNNGYWTINASATPTSGNYNVTLNSTNFTNSGGAAGWTVMKAATIAGPWGLQGSCVTTSTVSQTSRTGLNGFSVFAVAQTNTPLPIELLYFEGVNEGDHNVLRWSTATEQNNEFFYLERSTDGVTFEVIATLAGAGNSSQQLSYLHIDAWPAIGENYYRLKQTDFNGASTYSGIILVQYHPGNVYLDNLHPNPTNGAVLFDYVSPDATTITIVVTDIAGRIVHNEKRQLEGGRTEVSTLLQECGPGIYTLRVTDSQQGYSSVLRLVHH